MSLSIDVAVNNSESYGFSQSRFGEICKERCEAENGQVIIIVAICTSPNRGVKKIIEFVHDNLRALTETGSADLNRKLQKLPMIWSADFNVDFPKDKSKLRDDFLKSNINLIWSNDPNEGTANTEQRLKELSFDIQINSNVKYL